MQFRAKDAIFTSIFAGNEGRKGSCKTQNGGKTLGRHYQAHRQTVRFFRNERYKIMNNSILQILALRFRALEKTFFIFNVPGLKPPPLGGQLLAIEKAGKLR
jgi:hypothetical protein